MEVLHEQGELTCLCNERARLHNVINVYVWHKPSHDRNGWMRSE